jgi:hypothetical protein
MFEKSIEYGNLIYRSGYDEYGEHFPNLAYQSMIDEDFSSPLVDLDDHQLIQVVRLAVKNKTVGVLTARSRREKIDKDKISRMISEVTKESESW